MDVCSPECYGWVELLDPKSQRSIYVNLESGQCCLDPPSDGNVKPRSADQWWELADLKFQRNYYYNSSTRQTVWERPSSGDIIPLANIQMIQSASKSRAAPTSHRDVAALRRTNVRSSKLNAVERSFDSDISGTRFSPVTDFCNNRIQSLHAWPVATESQRLCGWLRDSSGIVNEGKNGKNVELSDLQNQSDYFSVRHTCQVNSATNVLGTIHPEVNGESNVTQGFPNSGNQRGLRSTHSDFSCIRGITSDVKLVDNLHLKVSLQPATLSSSLHEHDKPAFSSNSSRALLTHRSFTHILDSQNFDPECPSLGSKIGSTDFVPSGQPWRPSTPSSQLFPSPTYCSSGRRVFPRTNPNISHALHKNATVNGKGCDDTKPSCFCPTVSASHIQNLDSLGSRPTHTAFDVDVWTNGSSDACVTCSTSVRSAQGYHFQSPFDQSLVRQCTSGSEYKVSSISPSIAPIPEQPGSSGCSPCSHSPASDSPGLSSSSCSCSRASSTTALSNSSSEKNTDSVNVQQYATESLSVSDGIPAGLVSDPYLPNSPIPCPIACHCESELPPVPPPRSASTLGPAKLHSGSSHVPDQFDHPLVISHDTVCYSSHGPSSSRNPDLQYLLPDSKPIDRSAPHPCVNFVSSLSRQDPLRARIIQPHHRRQPPCLKAPFSSVGFEDLQSPHIPSQTSSELHLCDQSLTHVLSSGPSVSQSTDTDQHPVFYMNTDWVANSSSEASSSTATTWASRSSTAVGVAMEAPKTDVPINQAGDSSNPGCFDPANHVTPERSPSGGFIGPEDSTDDLRLGDSVRRRFGQPTYTLVHPCHPAFNQFIAPFNWPKDFFKPNQDMTSLMSWTKNKICRPLLVATDPKAKKTVLDTFKVIQSFMGDRKTNLSLPNYCSIIVFRAIRSASLRDEVFAQLCKQTTGNLDANSLTNGWALLCICLYYFSPNSKFRDVLEEYLVHRSGCAVAAMMECGNQTSAKSSLEAAAAIASGLPHFDLELPGSSSCRDKRGFSGIESLSIYSTVSALVKPIMSNIIPFSGSGDCALSGCDRPTAAHFARVAPRWFLRSVHVGSRKFSDAPSVEEICHVKELILKPCVFGSTLEDIMQIQSGRFPRLKLPWIQIFLTEEILRMDGCVTEGVFRLSADLDLSIEVRCQLEKLFETFKVIYNGDPQSAYLENEFSDRFVVVRPPPPGWFHTVDQLSFSSAEDAISSSVVPSSASSFPDAFTITGEYTWPIIPDPISLPSTEYVLVTPSSQWPTSLIELGRRTAPDVANRPVDCHLAASLLKLWLRELGLPLVPCSLRDECLKAACEAEAYEVHTKLDMDDDRATSSDDPIKKCCRIIRRIPILERRSLLYLIMLLQHLSKPEHSSLSLMDSRNLAVVIAPNLIRPDTARSSVFLENVRLQNVFVRMLISHLDVDEEVRALSAEALCFPARD